MNSMSRPVDHNEKDCGCKRPKDKEEQTVILKCKTGSPISIPSVPTVVANTNISRPATISVNTKHLFNPCIKFEFSTNIVSFLAAATPAGEPTIFSSVVVTFQLYRICRGETTAITVGSPWVYNLSNASDLSPIATADAFTFIVCECECDCDCDSDTCCTYYVQASTIGTGTASVNLNNNTLSALVVEKSNHC